MSSTPTVLPPTDPAITSIPGAAPGGPVPVPGIPLPAFDNTLGALFIGAVLSMMLYGIICLQMFIYITSERTKKDSIWTRLLAQSISASCGVLLTQLFFSWRIWAFSGVSLNSPTRLVICILTVLLALFSFGSSIDLAINGFNHRLLTVNTPDFILSYKLSACSRFVFDVFITLAMTWTLYRSRSGVKRSDHVIKLLIMFTVNTNLLTTLLSISELVTFLALPNATIYGGLGFLSPKLHAFLSLFHNMGDSFELQDEIQALQDVENYSIPSEHDPQSEDVERLLEAAVEVLAESSDSIADPEVFDVYRSILKHSDSVPGHVMSKLLDSILSGLQSHAEITIRDIDQEEQQVYMAHKGPMERFSFLLQWFVTAAEKVKVEDGDDATSAPPPKAKRGRGGKAATGRGTRAGAGKKSDSWTWSDQIPNVLNVIGKILKKLQVPRIWTTSSSKDNFINCLTRPAYHIAENEQYMKIAQVRSGVFHVIALAVKHHNHGHAARINIMQNLQYYEHLSEPMAECLNLLSGTYDYNQLGDEILRDIASKVFNAQDTKGPRNFSKFLVKYAELLPRNVMKQMVLLVTQLDSEAYPMRVAMVEIMGYLIKDLAQEEESAQIDKQLNNLFEQLIQRMLDISSYVRTKVLAVFIKICEMKDAKFPKQRLLMTDAAINSLDDKASTVRKSAVQLLTSLVETHPFGKMNGGSLQLSEWEEQYEKVKAELAKVEDMMGNVVVNDGEEAQDKEDGDGGNTEKEEEDDDDDGSGQETPSARRAKDDNDMDVDEDSLFMDDDDDEGATTPKKPQKKAKKKKGKLAPRKSELDVTAFSNETAALAALDGSDLLRMRLQRKYFVEALTFIRQLEGAMDKVCELLGSTNKSEALEAMNFSRVAHDYKLPSSEKAVKKMLHLIWSKDNSSTSEDGKELKGIRARLLECYRIMYIDDVPNMDPKSQINRIAKNLIELTYNATLAELTSLEEMMKSLMDEHHIDEAVISKLWQVYSSTQNLPNAQRRGAIIVLGMVALAKRSVVTDHVDTILKVGFGRLGKLDLTLARYSSVALQRLNGSAKKIKGSLLDKTLRLETDNAIFKKLQGFIQAPNRSKEWFGLAEQIINTIYALSEHPDKLCSDIIKNFTRSAFARQQQGAVPKDDSMDTDNKEKDADAMDEDHPTQESAQETEDEPLNESQETQGSKDTGDAFELAKLLFVVGHVAMKEIVYLELVEREWKRQKDEKIAADKAAGASAANRGTNHVEELDQVAGNAEDEIGDRIAEVRETELLYGPESLLAVYGPMLVHICGSPQKFKNRTLRAAATLSLSKFLCVSSQFCDQHHRLLFKILEISKDADIRSNIVIALGDVAVSFSSIIDENSNELYKGLSDQNIVVKKNTLMVLTHLILNGMIKVKGQLGEMAKCLEDDDSRIADLAKLFFTELATKDNAIYNNLPDVISHLSSGEHAVDEETFQSTLKYIFTFIEKEKQAENIVEKLCQRFRLTEDSRQWRDIAFCLSLLPFKSERSVKKLIEGLPNYRDKLHEEVVYQRFTEILQKARTNKSTNKPDTELDEFEKILEEHKLQGEEDQALEKRAESKKAAAKKRATRKKSNRKKVVAIQEEDDEDE
ncbi:Condensin complex subunit [Pleurotus pulmonarius]|nr:Condensin complex subunit [Pleurotus pulmonarius]